MTSFDILSRKRPFLERYTGMEWQPDEGSSPNSPRGCLPRDGCRWHHRHFIDLFDGEWQLRVRWSVWRSQNTTVFAAQAFSSRRRWALRSRRAWPVAPAPLPASGLFDETSTARHRQSHQDDMDNGNWAALAQQQLNDGRTKSRQKLAVLGTAIRKACRRSPAG